jgi:valyl-tRNA synthetase
MSVPLCSKTGDVIEYRQMPQWYLKCKPLAANVLKLMDQSVNFQIYPTSMNYRSFMLTQMAAAEVV